MKTKIFTAALILAAILSASCSYATVTPQQALADPRFAPYVEATKQNGSSLLSGRYAITTEITSRTGGQKILAPTNMIFNIGQFDTQINAYPLNADVYGSNIVPLYMTLDTQAQAPIIKTYRADSSGQYDVVGEDYAVVINQGGSRAWFVASVSDGEINYFFPLDDASLFPKGWYLGAWKCSDGTQFTFEGDTVSSNGQAIGTFNVSDNRIIVTTPDGQKDVIYALRNPEKDTLVMTFTSGPNGMGINADALPKHPKLQPQDFPHLQQQRLKPLSLQSSPFQLRHTSHQNLKCPQSFRQCRKLICHLQASILMEYGLQTLMDISGLRSFRTATITGGLTADLPRWG